MHCMFWTWPGWKTTALLSKSFKSAAETVAKRLASELLSLAAMSQSLKHPTARRRATPACSQEGDATGTHSRIPAQRDVSRLAAHPATDLPDSSVDAEPQAAAPVRPLAIMVVEDNRINRVLTMKMLNHLGYAADSVNNGRECMEALADKNYHLFLMDLQMPVMDGFATAREIRRRDHLRPATPPPYICALTAHELTAQRTASLAAGMDEFLIKPLRLEALKTVLNRVAENLENFQPL